MKTKQNFLKRAMLFVLAIINQVLKHKVIVVLKLPQSINSLCMRAQAIIEAMTGNSWFTTPSPTLTVLQGLLDDLIAAQVKTLSRTVGTVQARNLKAKLLIKSLNALRNYVQGICDNNEEAAETIALSSGMFVKKITGSRKYTFSASSTRSQEAELTGSVRSPRCSHEWGMSLDNKDEASWYVRVIPGTLKAKITITGLKSGTMVYFRHRVITKEGAQQWDTVIGIIII
jgi:hypothetical protein